MASVMAITNLYARNVPSNKVLRDVCVRAQSTLKRCGASREVLLLDIIKYVKSAVLIYKT